ncbi:hypothetical protein V6Z12_D03G164400 [Gossypium hirsutum]
MQSPGLTRAPTQSPDAAVQPIIPTQPPFQMMPGQRRTRDRKRGCRGALIFTNPHQRMSFKHRRRS